FVVNNVKLTTSLYRRPQLQFLSKTAAPNRRQLAIGSVVTRGPETTPETGKMRGRDGCDWPRGANSFRGWRGRVLPGVAPRPRFDARPAERLRFGPRWCFARAVARDRPQAPGPSRRLPCRRSQIRVRSRKPASHGKRTRVADHVAGHHRARRQSMPAPD